MPFALIPLHAQYQRPSSDFVLNIDDPRPSSSNFSNFHSSIERASFLFLCSLATRCYPFIRDSQHPVPGGEFLELLARFHDIPRWNSHPQRRTKDGISVRRGWSRLENLNTLRGTILFCGWNARYVRERGGSAHRLAVGLWSWGWLGPIIGRGGAEAGFWGCGGTLRFEGWSAISRGRLSYRPSIGSPRPRYPRPRSRRRCQFPSRWFVSL